MAVFSANEIRTLFSFQLIKKFCISWGLNPQSSGERSDALPLSYYIPCMADFILLSFLSSELLPFQISVH